MPPELSDTFDLITANYEIAVSVLGLVLLALVFYRKRNSALGALTDLENSESPDAARHLTPVAAADWMRLRIECTPQVIQFSRLAVLGPLFGVGLGSFFLFWNGGIEIELAALATPVFCGAMVAVLHTFYSIQVDRKGASLISAYANSYADAPKQLSEEMRRANGSLSGLIEDTDKLRAAYDGARTKLDDATDRLANLAERVEDLIKIFQKLPEELDKGTRSVESALTKIVADLPSVKEAVDGFKENLKESKKEVKKRSEHVVESYDALSKQVGNLKDAVKNLDGVANSFGDLRTEHIDLLKGAVGASVAHHAEALGKLIASVESKLSERPTIARAPDPNPRASGPSPDLTPMIDELKNITARLGLLENQLHQIGSRPAFIVWTRTQLRRVRDRIAHWRNSS